MKQLLSWCVTDFITNTSFDLDELCCRRLCYIFVHLFSLLFVLPLPWSAFVTLFENFKNLANWLLLCWVILTYTYSTNISLAITLFISWLFHKKIGLLLFSCLNKFNSVIAEVKQIYRLLNVQKLCNSQWILRIFLIIWLISKYWNFKWRTWMNV